MVLDFDIKNILILIVAIINFAYGTLIYFKDRKNITSFLFFFLTISVSIWGLSMFMFRSMQEEYQSLLFARVLYFSATIIPFIFVYFATIFPAKSFLLKPWQKYILPIPFIIIGVFSLAPDYLIKNIELVSGSETHILFNNSYNFFYIFYINIFFIYGYFLLFKKYFENYTKNIILSKQIIYIIAGTFISTIISLFTNLFLPSFGIFELNWVGQTTVIVMISTISYAILKYNLFSIKLIIVEIAILLFNLFILLNVFTSHETVEFSLNIFLFLSIATFSIILIRGVYKDIRDREKIAELARDMEIVNEHLRVVERQKTEFVSIASHQLRTPLTVIKGYASMILEGTFGKISDGARDAMEKLYKSNGRITSLVEDLLTVSRIEQGRLALHFELADLAKLTEEVVAEMSEEFKNAGVTVSFATRKNKQFIVSVDKNKFKQVLKHIFDNAIKYEFARGNIVITVDDDRITNEIRLAISDTGIGMTEEQIKSLSDRFSLKANDVEKERNKISKIEGNKKERHTEEYSVYEEIEDKKEKDNDGEMNTLETQTHGLGLYITKEIIDAHNGVLRVESAGLSKGTTVIVELPRWSI